MIDQSHRTREGRHLTGDLGVRLLITIVPLLACACTPTVRVAAPTEPITINLNVRIDQEVRVRLDREVEELIADNPDLF
ncbi:MAG TPA: YnbE family lipoprotein [Hyphomonadaceae bacterium]|nr:hypothetical protein [Ponticaulis sp.]RPG18499.1 MAG: YnbE family lipoprotein [Hyphomonadaceae bacterium TMED125]HBH90043.1 YnbE family lipoprotein [Hyphomonadaceae bacterium]HBJ92224.1 YnbE family lipoprotein [Hyphomonadaceae bacterium]|tara:strand:- start:43656 stop:43892 length:237 start_codon:yes stop_codon:yes gene_type:complete